MTSARITTNAAPMRSTGPLYPQSREDAEWLRIAAERRSGVPARPPGELSLWAGTMLVAAVCALAGLFAVMA